MDILYYILLWLLSHQPKEKITFINDGVSKDLVCKTAAFVSKSLDIDVEYAPAFPITKAGFGWHPFWESYNSIKVLKYLDTVFNNRTILITNKGLGYYVLCASHSQLEWQQVFGQSSSSDSHCVITTYSLDSADMVEQSEVLAMHELGHTYGLSHCKDSTCYMTEGNGTTACFKACVHYCEYCSKQLKKLRSEIKRFDW